MRFPSATRISASLAVALLIGLGAAHARADTYITFRGARYYSPLRTAFVEITPAGRISVYRNKRGVRPLWTERLAYIPGKVLVTDDGGATILIDAYYGNAASTVTSVLSVRDKTGRVVQSYGLAGLAEIAELVQTVSRSDWYERAWLTDDQRFLCIATVRRKCKPPHSVTTEADLQRFDECNTSVSSEVLRFDLTSGALVERKPALRTTPPSN